LVALFARQSYVTVLYVTVLYMTVFRRRKSKRRSWGRRRACSSTAPSTSTPSSAKPRPTRSESSFSSSLFLTSPELSDTKSTSLKYEPASEPLLVRPGVASGRGLALNSTRFWKILTTFGEHDHKMAPRTTPISQNDPLGKTRKPKYETRQQKSEPRNPKASLLLRYSRYRS